MFYSEAVFFAAEPSLFYPAPVERIEEPRKPDAVIFRAGWRPPSANPALDNFNVQLDFIEPLIGKGQCAISELKLGENMLIVAPYRFENGHAVSHSYLYPDGHRLQKSPMHVWVDHESGCRLGFLKEPM